jgi:hypothetical protein
MNKNNKCGSIPTITGKLSEISEKNAIRPVVPLKKLSDREVAP